MSYARPLSSRAEQTAKTVNAFIDEATRILAGTPKANTVLLRGFSKHPSLPSLSDLYRLNPAAIATYPMYRGLARLVGMNILDAGPETGDLFQTLEKHYPDYDFFFIHFKKTDSAGEDGNRAAKIAAIEEIDGYIPRLLALKPEVLVVTADHSTPCQMKSHSWHPNPILIHSQSAMPDRVIRFGERDCSQGYLGRFQAINIMPIVLAHAGKLMKYGA